MASYKLDIAKMDDIVKKTLDAMNLSKKEICDIAESARRECNNLEQELELLKKQAKELIEEVEIKEKELAESKKKLLLINKNFDKFSQDELKNAYEKADNLRVELVVKREKEQYFIKRRNDLEVRIKDSYRTVQKADGLMAHVGVALEFLGGDLKNISSQIEGLQQKQMLGLKIIKAQEEERQRVAREIHDGPAQSMSNVVLKAEICEKLIDVDIEKSRLELRNLKKIVRDCLVDVRKIIYNLRPMSLDDLGLIPTLQRYLATFQEEHSINVIFRTRGSCEDLSTAVTLTMFRIVQEALNNTKKYANAKQISVSIEFLDERIVLIISDDGVGFNVDEIKVKQDINGGFGLFSMRERVELLEGEMEIKSKSGMGTRLSVSIPLTHKERDLG